MIYLDNAATTLKKPEQVIDAVVNAMRTMGNSSRGTHEVSLGTSRTIFDTRIKLAEFFGADDPENVIFTCNSTEALNIAIRGTVSEGDHVITSVLEHNSVLRPLYLLEKEKGVSLSFMSSDSRGNIDPEEIRELLRPETRAVVITHASNLTGNMTDIKRITGIAHEYGLLTIVDASQTAGSKKIDVKDMGIDILCFTGHKAMMGPQGTGGMVIGKDVDVRPFKVGGTGIKSYLTSQPEEYPARLEAGTMNGHGIAGLNAALDFICSVGIDEIDRKEQELMERFHDGVKDIPGVKIYGDFDAPRTAIVCLNIGDCDSGQISDVLAVDHGIATRPGAHCAPLMHKALGTVSQGAVRFSFSYFNTFDEVDQAVNAVKEIAEELKK